MLDRAEAMTGEMVRLRRDIHQHPELAFQEFRTAGLVADMLAEIGIEAQSGVGRTGVIGRIGSGDGPTIGIRADMDALPILEKNDVPYRSSNDGVMHACGHDAHTAILLGVAQLLRQSFIEDDWRGNVRLLFQPAEEGPDENGISGATAMIDDAAIEDVDAVIALHVISDLPAGECFFHDGFSLASVDSFKGWIRGQGGHGAYPHQTRDPLFMLGPILSALYGIPSRRINPLRESVVSLGQIHAGTTSNVIPAEVFLEGTIRAYDPAVREALRSEVERALQISETMGGSYEFELTCGYPALNNDPLANGWLRESATDILGESRVQDQEFGMGAEDFAYMTQKAPGAMFMLGAALPDDVERRHHSDNFDVDESVLPVGAAVLAETARRFVTGRYSLEE
ncbi:MAG: amidohydrolase [Chloroflexota bacterium]|nr:MAG: amidohydrolase [Chloroflexota bacterium]